MWLYFLTAWIFFPVIYHGGIKVVYSRKASLVKICLPHNFPEENGLTKHLEIIALSWTGSGEFSQIWRWSNPSPCVERYFWGEGDGGVLVSRRFWQNIRVHIVESTLGLWKTDKWFDSGSKRPVLEDHKTQLVSYDLAVLRDPPLGSPF